MKTGIASKYDGKCYLCNQAYSQGTFVEGYDSTDQNGQPKKRYGHVACVNSMSDQTQSLQRPPTVGGVPVTQFQQPPANNATLEALTVIRDAYNQAIEILRAG